MDYVIRNGAGALTRIFRTLMLVVALSAAATSSVAEEPRGDDLKSLDGQVQEIKGDVLSIASDLAGLEERLLYPTNTQVAVFVAVNDESFRLDAIHLEIDGEAATHHIYSYQELEALRKGGVQRLFTGNVPTGSHEISVRVVGRLDNGKDFERSNSYNFAKGVEPKTIGITLDRPGSGDSGIQVGDW